MELEEYYAKKTIGIFKERVIFDKRNTVRDCFKSIIWLLENCKDEVRSLSDETFEKNIFEGFLDYEGYWLSNEQYKTDLAKVLGKAAEISIKNEKPLSIEDIIGISRSKAQVWGNFLYQCLVYYSRKKKIDLESREIDKIFLEEEIKWLIFVI